MANLERQHPRPSGRRAVYDYGNGTHNAPYWQRDFERSFPLILNALGL